MMKLYLVRHGQSIGNKKNILQGHTQFSLTEKGIEQAKRVGSRLAKDVFDKIISSDLRRAKETAKEIIKHHQDTETIFTENVREQSWGVLEGKSSEEFNNILDEKEDPLSYKPENGMSINQYKKHVSNYINDLRDEHEGKKILIISHGGFITNTLMQAINAPEHDYEQYSVDNTSVSIINYSKEEIELMNCIKHIRKFEEKLE